MDNDALEQLLHEAQRLGLQIPFEEDPPDGKIQDSAPNYSSDSSAGSRSYRTSISLATTSVTSASSSEPPKPARNRLKKSLRRIPGFSRKRDPILAKEATCEMPRPQSSRLPHQPRQAVLPARRSLSEPRVGAAKVRVPSLRKSLSRKSAIFDARLQNLRRRQLQDQCQLLAARATDLDGLQTRCNEAKRRAQDEFECGQESMLRRHETHLANLEDRQFSADNELLRTLETERVACNTRLKYMQAYCNPHHHVEGMPKRTVTASDQKMLELQQHVRDGLAALHSNRINVLRERQARQLEGLAQKHEQEKQEWGISLHRNLCRIDENHEAERVELEKEFEQRRHRFLLRWRLTEAIERRKLQLETGHEYGPLPEIEWSRDLAFRLPSSKTL